MNALTFNTAEATQEELNLVRKRLDVIACEIMDNEENEDNWMALKSCREVMNSINKADCADCAYTAYVNTHAAQVWAQQAVDAINEDRSID